MKKADFTKLNVQLTRGNEQARMVPFFEGDLIPLTLEQTNIVERNELLRGRSVQWNEFKTDDGDAISFTQLLRRRNGLKLDGNTMQERFNSFITLFDDEGHLQLRVSKVQAREGVDDEGAHTLARYLIFEIA